MDKDQVNILKGVAIVGVVGLHFLSAMSWLGLYHGVVFQASLVVDIFLRFSVPMFVVLSGYALTAKYLNQKLDLREFYVHRVLKLLPLYLFWTAVIYLVVHLYQPWSGFVSASNIWQIIFLGRGDYHLYFVPMIFQLYILFPLLFVLIRRYPMATLASALVLNVAVYMFYAGASWPDQARYFWFFSWVFYFVLGMFLVGNKFKEVEKLGKFAMLAGLTWAILVAETQLSLGRNIIDVTTFTTVPVLVFVTGSILWVMEMVEKIKLVRFGFLKSFGEMSYLIYLSHTLVLRILLGARTDPVGMILPTAVVAAAFVLTRFFK